MQRILQPAIDQLTPIVGGYVLNLLGAVAILVVGWLVAMIASSLIRGVLSRTSADNRMAQWIVGDAVASVPIERIVSRGVFYLLMVFVLVAFFQALQLTAITEPLNALLQTITEFIPRVLAAGVLLLLAMVVASVLRRGLTLAAEKAEIDRRFGAAVVEEGLPLARTLGEGIYWLVLILFLPAVLGALALEGLLGPVQEVMQQLLGFIPNVFGAALILFLGWVVARLVQRVVTSLLAAVGIDRLSDEIGLDRVLGTARLSDLAGLVTYILILVPVVMAALDTLSLEVITGPATEMLERMLAVVPAVFAAALLLLVAYVVARIVSGLATRLLAAIGFDNVLAHLGISTEVDPGRAPSAVTGRLILVAILLLASVEASAVLGFDTLATLVSDFLLFGARILLGLVILAIGLYLSRLAAETIRTSGAAQAAVLAVAARSAIVVLAGTMALQQMNVASGIITLAFGILLGTVGVAAAIAFGLGSREAAGRAVEGWMSAWRGR